MGLILALKKPKKMYMHYGAYVHYLAKMCHSASWKSSPNHASGPDLEVILTPLVRTFSNQLTIAVDTFYNL